MVFYHAAEFQNSLSYLDDCRPSIYHNRFSVIEFRYLALRKLGRSAEANSAMQEFIRLARLYPTFDYLLLYFAASIWTDFSDSKTVQSILNLISDRDDHLAVLLQTIISSDNFDDWMTVIADYPTLDRLSEWAIQHRIENISNDQEKHLIVRSLQKLLDKLGEEYRPFIDIFLQMPQLQ